MKCLWVGPSAVFYPSDLTLSSQEPHGPGTIVIPIAQVNKLMDERNAVTFTGLSLNPLDPRAQAPVTSLRIVNVHGKEVASSFGECHGLCAIGSLVKGNKLGNQGTPVLLGKSVAEWLRAKSLRGFIIRSILEMR